MTENHSRPNSGSSPAPTGMKKPLKQALIAGVIAMVLIGGVEAIMAGHRNDFFEFCTTKAYGWPAPWKVDYCECEGSRSEVPLLGLIVNLSCVVGAGVGTFVTVGGLALWRRRL